MTKPVTCYRCNAAMVPQPEPLDLSWAGGLGGLQGPPRDSNHGPNSSDTEFRGILVEVHRCPSCAGVATRPVTIELPGRARLAAAV
jgi:hypothetical protein